MLTWMLYVILITLLLGAAALAAEHVARLNRARSRWIWVTTIVASLVIPTIIATVSIQIPNLFTPTVPLKTIPLRDLTSVQVVPLTWVQEHTGNIVLTHNENRVLQRVWIAVSVALLAALVFNGLQLAWRKRRWQTAIIAGVSVYTGRDVGPAVVGLFRPQIVVPQWLEEASPSRQVMVLTHEQAHLAAHDPQLLTVALFLLVLMPWNLPLWWQLHRLRYAIEVDCDARVLNAGLDTGQYGETLIDVSQRPSGYIGSVAAMSEPRSFLEERITIMVRDPAKSDSLVVLMLGCVSVALLALAAQITPPNIGSSEWQQALRAPQVLNQFVGFYVRGSGGLLLGIRREGSKLVIYQPREPDMRVFEVFARSETELVFGPAMWTLRRDEHGQVTGLVEHYFPKSRHPFDIPWQRVDASTAQDILATNKRRAQTQTPAPGSEAAVRRLVEGISKRKPNYNEMAPWFAELVKETSYYNEPYVRWGAVLSVEFTDVDLDGGDDYIVRQERGVSTWGIWLDSSGVIVDAQNYRH